MKKAIGFVLIVMLASAAVGYSAGYVAGKQAFKDRIARQAHEESLVSVQFVYIDRRPPETIRPSLLCLTCHYEVAGQCGDCHIGRSHGG